MALIKSLRTTPQVLRNNPVLFVPVAIFALLQVPQLFLQTVDPIRSLVGSILFMAVFLFITPAFYAGTIGMSNDAVTGVQTSLGRFWKHTKSAYGSVLLAYLAVSGVLFGFSLLFAFGTLIAAFAVDMGGGGLPLTIGLALAFSLIILAFLSLLFAIHFYAHAIVIEGGGPVGGLSRSVHVIRHNLRPVGGYGILSLVVGGFFGVGYALLMSFIIPTPSVPGQPTPTPDLGPALIGTFASVVGTTVFMAFFVVFTAVFYCELVGINDSPAQQSTSTPETGGGELQDIQTS